jgi:hypothetical protein
MRIDFRRVFLIALALGASCAWVAVRLQSRETRVDAGADVAPASPIFDASDPEIRRLLAWTGSDDEALFRNCAVDQPDRIRIAATPGYRPGSRQRELSITRQGAGASLDYFERAFPVERLDAPGTVHAKVQIEASERSTLDELFVEAGYPAKLAPTEGESCPDAGLRLVESCLGGRYYAVFRSCDPGAVDRLAEDAFAFARKKVVARGQPVPPQAVTFKGEVVITRHGAFVIRDGREKPYALAVPARFAANDDIERVLTMGGALRGGGGSGRGRFTGLIKGPPSVAWFELQSAENLEQPDEAR